MKSPHPLPIVLLAATLACCATVAAPPPTDLQLTTTQVADLVDNLSLLSTHPPDPDTLARIAMDQCAALASCAAGCKRELGAAAEVQEPSRPGADRHEAILEPCFEDLRKEHAATGISGDAWISKYFSAYLDRAQSAIPSDRRKDFTEARAALHL